MTVMTRLSMRDDWQYNDPATMTYDILFFCVFFSTCRLLTLLAFPRVLAAGLVLLVSTAGRYFFIVTSVLHKEDVMVMAMRRLYTFNNADDDGDGDRVVTITTWTH